MGQDIFASVLTLALTLLPLNASNSALTPQQQTVQSQVNTVMVKPGDSLSSIAQAEYGSIDFWTNVWNDNPTIKDPSLIEQGDRIKIEVNKPEKPAELKDELATRIKARQQLAYAQEEAVTPKREPQTTPEPQNTAPVNASGPLNQDQINFLGNCESGMTAGRNSGNGYYGAFQFSYGTWQSMGTAYERADMAPLEVQVDAAQRLIARSSIFTQFPGCSGQMRAQGIL